MSTPHLRDTVLAKLPASVGDLATQTGQGRGEVLGALTALLHERRVEFDHARQRWQRPRFVISTRTGRGITDALAGKARAGLEVERAAAQRRVLPEGC